LFLEVRTGVDVHLRGGSDAARQGEVGALPHQCSLLLSGNNGVLAAAACAPVTSLAVQQWQREREMKICQVISGRKRNPNLQGQVSVVVLRGTAVDSPSTAVHRYNINIGLTYEPLLIVDYQQRFHIEPLLIVFFRQIKKSDALFSIFLSCLINHCCFIVNLFIRLDNIFPCLLINQLIKLMFL
jgi:hypothetical protein